MKSLDQLRAEHAYGIADRYRDNDDFRNLAEKLPVMMRTNGLLATWAFLMAKKYHDMAQALQCHLTDPVLGLRVPEGDDITVFRRWVGELGSQTCLNGTDLRRLTEEAIAFAGWLRRAVQAYKP
ncbi:MAG: type III-B CRISPR module-associated protein Cmr5 [Acidobacteria bacterium]|nr:type III-B CRISPR module-associated protein Cmr5 [Acidobacteriota bacterium]